MPLKSLPFQWELQRGRERQRCGMTSSEPPSVRFKVNEKEFLCIDWACCDGKATAYGLWQLRLSPYISTEGQQACWSSPSVIQPSCEGGRTLCHQLSFMLSIWLGWPCFVQQQAKFHLSWYFRMSFFLSCVIMFFNFFSNFGLVKTGF